ncbi:MAG: molybdopterin dinucleotide binding domain-containing protein, partial [Solirubrobacterales bacterium]
KLLDLLIRTGPEGDFFGARPKGWSIGKLRKKPHGVVLADGIPTGVLRKRVRHKDKLLKLAPDEIVAEIERLATVNGGDPAFPMRLIGLRELRSHNSWMHNAPLLMRGGRTHAARIHPDDAEGAGIADGERVRISSPHGSIELQATLTDEVKRGTVAVPHGWGHSGGWTVANAAGGANVNQLASSDPADLERLAGMAHLNGIPVRLDAVDLPAGDGEAAVEYAPSA